jgi:RND family efflux transporter MFP subunit
MKAKLPPQLAVLAGVGAVLLLAGCGPPPATTPQKAPPPVMVKTTSPGRGPIARSLTLPAFRILAYQEATLYAKVSGYLKTLTVDKGDSVQAGQLLAEIEVPELLADEVQHLAETDVARTNYEQWQVARAKLQRTQTLLQFTHVTAPFSGIITARLVDPGAYIPAATSGNSPQSVALVTIMDCRRLRVQVFVPEAEVPLITNGVPVKLAVEELAGRTFSGVVTRFAYALDQATKTMLTEIELSNPDGKLRPGMYASVKFEIERKPDALLLPVAAVAVEKTGSFVYLVADGKAKKTAVRTGFNDGANVEITEGLQATQPVILIGKQALNDGQAVSLGETGK